MKGERRMKTSMLLVAILLVSTQVSFGRQKEQKPDMLQVIDARLGKDIKDRSIAEEDSSFAKDSKVFIWMKFTGGASGQITVTWKTGEYSHSTTLSIGGSPWRTWASKTVSKTGEWTVSVTDSSGNVLKEMKFGVK